jgi:hypothetical protein
VEGQNPLLSAAVTKQVSQILDDYLRDLYAYAEASLTDFQLRQRASFYDPTVASSTPSQSSFPTLPVWLPIRAKSCRDNNF